MASTRLESPRQADATGPSNGQVAGVAGSDLGGAAHQAFWLLRIGFTVAPILFGVDKFFNWTVHWPDYLAGWVNDIIPGSGRAWRRSSAVRLIVSTPEDAAPASSALGAQVVGPAVDDPRARARADHDPHAHGALRAAGEPQSKRPPAALADALALAADEHRH